MDRAVSRSSLVGRFHGAAPHAGIDSTYSAPELLWLHPHAIREWLASIPSAAEAASL